MAIKEAFLLDVGWLFLAAWIVVILGAGWLTFGNDLKKPAKDKAVSNCINQDPHFPLSRNLY